MSNKLNMTEAQIERQGQKIMDLSDKDKRLWMFFLLKS